ncbi:MAG TPA: GNAT family N-acetyltransferase, partial [Microthrixaceae bacterium]|nr:GNAT family N-acetyltransferase [Microthrixaceae bacterium]
NGASGDERLLVRDLQHTVIDPEQRGRGLGSVLVPAVLDDIRARGAKLMPTCPFVRGWIDEHPDQQDLVA